ncbi:hypothetical protein MJD09_26220 [bacterium]|nr:hypothetical protein [bacterium]
MKIVKTQLAHNASGNQDTRRNSNRKTKDVDKGIQLFLPQITDGDFEVVSQYIFLMG